MNLPFNTSRGKKWIKWDLDSTTPTLVRPRQEESRGHSLKARRFKIKPTRRLVLAAIRPAPSVPSITTWPHLTLPARP